MLFVFHQKLIMLLDHSNFNDLILSCALTRKEIDMYDVVVSVYKDMDLGDKYFTANFANELFLRLADATTTVHKSIQLASRLISLSGWLSNEGRSRFFFFLSFFPLGLFALRGGALSKNLLRFSYLSFATAFMFVDPDPGRQIKSQGDRIVMATSVLCIKVCCGLFLWKRFNPLMSAEKNSH